MEPKILTLHPQGKRGVNISRSKYETMKKTILEILGKAELTHAELTAAVERKLKGNFDGSIPCTWREQNSTSRLAAQSSACPVRSTMCTE
jgi:uncharacterized protein DUF6958